MAFFICVFCVCVHECCYFLLFMVRNVLIGVQNCSVISLYFLYFLFIYSQLSSICCWIDICPPSSSFSLILVVSFVLAGFTLLARHNKISLKFSSVCVFVMFLFYMLLLLIYSTTEIKFKRCCLTFIVHEYADSRCDRVEFLTCRSFTRFRLCSSILFATREARVLLDLIRISIWNSRATLSLSLSFATCVDWTDFISLFVSVACIYCLFRCICVDTFRTNRIHSTCIFDV